MKVYCVYDRVAQEGGPLFTAKNDGVALRIYRQLIVREKVENESDYLFYCLGEYDPEQPVLLGDVVPTIIDTSEDDNE